MSSVPNDRIEFGFCRTESRNEFRSVENPFWSKDQTDMVQSKIREQIQAEINAKNRIKKKQTDKRLKVSPLDGPSVQPWPVHIEKLIVI